MATFEERLIAIEHEHEEFKQEHEELKQKFELHTIAIGALVNKATLERLSEKNDKLFDALIAHDQFTNQQLAELREKVEVQIEGKIVGLQTAMRQGFEAVNTRFEQQDGKIVGLQTEMRQSFKDVEARFEAVDKRLETVDKRLEAIDNRLNTMDNRFDRLEALLGQVIGRLPPQP